MYVQYGTQYYRLYAAKQEVLEDLRTGTTRLDRDLVERIRTSTTRTPNPTTSQALLQEITALFAGKLSLLS